MQTVAQDGSISIPGFRVLGFQWVEAMTSLSFTSKEENHRAANTSDEDHHDCVWNSIMENKQRRSRSLIWAAECQFLLLHHGGCDGAVQHLHCHPRFFRILSSVCAAGLLARPGPFLPRSPPPPLTAGQLTRWAVMRAHNNVCRRHTLQEHPSLL